MYIYIYVYIYICIYIYIYVYIYMYVYVYIYIYIYMYMYIYVYVYVYIYIYIYVYMYVYVYIYSITHAHNRGSCGRIVLIYCAYGKSIKHIRSTLYMRNNNETSSSKMEFMNISWLLFPPQQPYDNNEKYGSS